jgi:hypothetical protein
MPKLFYPRRRVHATLFAVEVHWDALSVPDQQRQHAIRIVAGSCERVSDGVSGVIW